jgi:hypothetical protein
VTIYAFAEDNGVSTSRTFVIPKPDQKGPTVDRTKPATLRKKLDFRGNADAFAAINAVKALQARIGGASIDIGEGTRNVSTRFGSDSVITADHLDQFIATARETIEDPTADVKLSFRELRFTSGYDLETFLAKLGIEIVPGEVDQ